MKSTLVVHHIFAANVRKNKQIRVVILPENKKDWADCFDFSRNCFVSADHKAVKLI